MSFLKVTHSKYYINLANYFTSLRSDVLTALHRGMSKYLTAQDTHFSSTASEHDTTMYSLFSQLSCQSWSTIQVNSFCLAILLSSFIQKLDIALSWT